MPAKRAAPRVVVRKAVLKTARIKRQAGNTSADWSRKEALRTTRQVIRDVKRAPTGSKLRLAPEFKNPIRQTQGVQKLRKVKRALGTIKNR